MNDRRTWLGWRAHPLEAAVRWLADRAGDGPIRDLRGWWCVTPGQRAGRVLLAMLARTSEQEGCGLVPPRIITPGRLADDLLPTAPAGPAIADTPATLFAWVDALRAMPPDDRAALVPVPPPEGDVSAHLALARLFESLCADLASHHLDPRDVPARAAEHGLDLDPARWNALHHAREAWRGRLLECGLVDRDSSRARRLDHARANPSSLDHVRGVLLVGVLELTPAQRQALDALGDRVHALVHAPRELQSEFDDFGCARVESAGRWMQPITDPRIIMVDQPSDQAAAVVVEIDRAARNHQATTDAITIGAADASLADLIRLTASLAGVSVHWAAGRPVRESPAARLLQAVVDHLQAPTVRTLAALARHPWIDRRLNHKRSSPMSLFPGALDRARARTMHVDLRAPWPAGVRESRLLRRAQRVIDALIADLARGERPLGAWAASIARFLEAVTPRSRSRPDPITQRVHAALIDAAESLARLSPSLQPRVAAPQAIQFLLMLLDEAAEADDIQPDQVEMLGWLELHLDCAPTLIIAGANEGALPALPGAGDPFLSDGVRRALGVPNSLSRSARDGCMLRAMIESGRDVTLIAGRRDALGSPVAPSRLLLECDDEHLARRVLGLVDTEDEAHAPRIRFSLPPQPAHAAIVRSTEGGEMFALPPINSASIRIERMRVTGFRDYLACPYRFALRHLLGLERVEDDAHELDAPTFGSLLHQVLKAFADDPAARDLTDGGRLSSWLSRALDDHAHRAHGSSLSATVRVQLERMRRRLDVFAHRQAAIRAEGWRMLAAEFTLTDASLDLSDQPPMPLTGRIDRIDLHESSGALRIIDYKAGDGGATPIKTHHGRARIDSTRWIDLQLPLYEHLVRGRTIAGIAIAPDRPIALAYFILPKHAPEQSLIEAPWEARHLAEAVECARTVVRSIRAGDFTPAADRHREHDPFAFNVAARLAAMRAQDRAAHEQRGRP